MKTVRIIVTLVAVATLAHDAVSGDKSVDIRSYAIIPEP